MGSQKAQALDMKDPILLAIFVRGMVGAGTLKNTLKWAVSMAGGRYLHTLGIPKGD